MWNYEVDVPLEVGVKSRVPHPPSHHESYRPHSALFLRDYGASMADDMPRRPLSACDTIPNTFPYNLPAYPPSKTDGQQAKKQNEIRDLRTARRTTDFIVPLNTESLASIRASAYRKQEGKLVTRQAARKAWDNDLLHQMKVLSMGTKYFVNRADHRKKNQQEQKMLQLRTSQQHAAKLIQKVWRAKKSKKELFRRALLRDAGLLSLQDQERLSRTIITSDEQEGHADLKEHSKIKRSLTLNELRSIVQDYRSRLIKMTEGEGGAYNADQLIAWVLNEGHRFESGIITALGKGTKLTLEPREFEEERNPTPKAHMASVTQGSRELARLQAERQGAKQREKDASERVQALELLLARIQSAGSCHL